jgi:outer membrane protein assembly factor BamD
MLRKAITIFCLVAVLSPLQALNLMFWKDKPIDTSPGMQTEQARPYYEKGLEAQRAGKYRSALRSYKKIYKKYPASAYTAQSLYNTGVIQFERKKWKKSASAFQAVLIYHPDFPLFNEMIEYQFNIALAQAEGDGVRTVFFIPSRAYNRSVSYFELVIQNAPYSDLAPLALMNVALIHQYQNNTAEAIDALDRLINLYPQSLLADDAYLSLAETFATLVQGPEYDQGATREAISYFEDFLILFSQHQEVARAEQGLADMEDVYARSKLVIGEYYFKHRRWFQAAEIFFNEAITTAPDSPAAESARNYLDQIEAIRNNRPPPPENSPERQKEKSFIKRFTDAVIFWK